MKNYTILQQIIMLKQTVKNIEDYRINYVDSDDRKALTDKLCAKKILELNTKIVELQFEDDILDYEPVEHLILD